MAKAPRPGGDKADTSITVSIDGVEYVCRPSDVTAKMAGQLRKESGMSVRAVMVAAADDPDLDVIAALVWLARRQTGEKVTWDEVADAITYDSEIGSAEGDAPDEDPEDSPEA